MKQGRSHAIGQSSRLALQFLRHIVHTHQSILFVIHWDYVIQSEGCLIENILQ